MPLKVSQASAVKKYDHFTIAAGGEFIAEAPLEPEIQGDGTNACSFLSLYIAELLLISNNSECGVTNVWASTATSIETVIRTAPDRFNSHRDVSKFYDVSEAYALLKKAGLIGTYSISEEFYANQTEQQAFMHGGKVALRNAIRSLQTSEATKVAVYTCGGYTFVVGCRFGDFFYRRHPSDTP